MMILLSYDKALRGTRVFVVLRKRDVGLVIGEISSSVWVEDFTVW